jgi:hypothetical protein
MNVFESSFIWGCGTIRCAGGWAAVDPEFMKQGLRWDMWESRIIVEERPILDGFGALGYFFGLDVLETSRLFGPGYRRVSREEVIANIDLILAGKLPVSYRAKRT